MLYYIFIKESAERRFTMGTVIKKKIAGEKETILFILLCWLTYACSYIGRLNLSASMSDMVADGIFLKSQAGAVTTGYFLCYGGGQFLSGWLGDKFQPRFLIFIGLLLSAGCNFCISLEPPLWLLATLWSLNGLSLSLLWAPLIKLVSDRVSSERRRRACTILATTMAAGTLVSYLLCAALIRELGWNASFYVPAAIAAAVAFLWFFLTARIEKEADKSGIEETCLCPMSERDSEKAVSDDEVPHDEVPTKLFPLLVVSGLLTMTLVAGVLSILKDCTTTWAPTFLTDAYRLDSVTSVLFGTLLPVFGLMGPYMASRIMRHVQDEFTSMFWLLIISSCALAVLVLLGRNSLGVAVFCLALTYACSLGQNMLLIGTIPMYFLNVGRVAGVTGVLNASACFGTAVMSLLTGILVERFSWEFTMTIWLLLSMAAAVLCVVSRRRWKKFRRNLF